MLLRHAVKEGVALIAGTGLQGELGCLGEGGDTSGVDFAVEFVPRGQPPDEDRVLAGFIATQAMIEVANDELVPAARHEKVKQGHGITSAGDPNESGRMRAKLGVESLKGVKSRASLGFESGS